MQFVQRFGNGFGSSLISELLTSSSDPAEKQSQLFILVESQGCDQASDSAKMDSFLTSLYESSAIENGVLAHDSKQMEEIWAIRESCNPSVASAGFVHKFDVSIPIEMYIEVSEEVEKQLQDENLHDLSVCTWGHVADGNAHINIVSSGQFHKHDDTAEKIENIVYSSVMKRKGSISAEHGIGQSKRKYLKHIKDDGELELMSQIKMAFDPHSILNPGKYIP
jgi:FAD/FMN-containing dehydrogenase